MTLLSEAETGKGHISGYGSPRYRGYVLNALLFVYILNFVDRNLLAVVAPQLKPELGLSDTEFGLLTGFGFALLYTIVGIPLAQYSERRNRVRIMSVCIALWSFMTVLCGLSASVTIGSLTIGAFWVLLACRVGVGIGEAGCTPPANSLISDYFPPRSRPAALGYYSMGVTLGVLLANVIGGPVAEAFGWRMAFLILGAPGLLVALVFALTVKEPPRGYSDLPGTVKKEQPTFRVAVREISSKRSFWTMTAGSTIASFCATGIATFQSLFLNRSFGLSVGDAALMINAPVALACAAGTVGMGWAAGRLSARYPNAIAWLPAIGLILAVPFYILAFTTDSLLTCLVGLCIGGAIKYGYMAAQYTICQGVVAARTRAVSTALLLFVVNLLGYGLGPLFIGFLSDLLFHWQLANHGLPELTRAACEGGTALLTASERAVCAKAHPESLRNALIILASFYTISGAMFFLTCRWLQRDLVAR